MHQAFEQEGLITKRKWQMAIRWRREERMTGLMRATQGHRKLYLLDGETDTTLMRIEWRNALRGKDGELLKPEGFVYIVCTPPNQKNLTSVARWPMDQERDALAAAQHWWKDRREWLLKLYEDYRNGK